MIFVQKRVVLSPTFCRVFGALSYVRESGYHKLDDGSLEDRLYNTPHGTTWVNEDFSLRRGTLRRQRKSWQDGRQSRPGTRGREGHEGDVQDATLVLGRGETVGVANRGVESPRPVVLGQGVDEVAEPLVVTPLRPPVLRPSGRAPPVAVVVIL